jgi:hypothetical protein
MDYDLEEAVKHVVHDYVCLVAAGTDLQRPQKHPFNHYVERAFLVHCRALGEFFSDRKTVRDNRDLRAQDFTRESFVRSLTIWDHWRDHIDKHLMHLTKSRVTNKVRWTGGSNKCILEEVRVVWHEFIGELKDDLQPSFERELNKRTREFVDYHF